MTDDIFKLTFEKAAVGIAHVDASGRWIHANQQLCDFLGYTRTELFCKTFKEITFPEDLEWDLIHAGQLYRGESDSFSIEKRYVRKDGLPVWASLSVSAIRNPLGKVDYFIAVIKDINLRKQTQIALEDEKNRAKLYLDVANVMLVSMDQNATVRLINPKGCKILGYREDELLGKNWFDAVIPEKVRSELESVLIRLMAGEIALVEYHENPIITKSGEERIIAWNCGAIRDNHGNITGIMASGEDITEQKRAYKETNKLLENLKKAETISKIGNWSLDLAANRLEWSDEIFHIFEIDKEQFEATYDGFLDIIHPDDRAEVAFAYENSLITKQKYEITHRLLMKDGRVKYVNEQCETEFDGKGSPVYSIGTVQDVSEQIEYQMRLESSKNSLLNLLEASPIAVRIAKNDGTNVVFANSAYARLIQTDRSTVLGKNPKNYYADQEEYDALVHQINEKERIYDRLIELSINNQTRWALASYMPMEFEGESCVLGWFYDITEQKNLQIELEQQKEEFETIFNVSKDGIAVLDMEFNFLDFNEAYIEMTGFTREELLGTSCISLSIPEDRDRAAEAMKCVIEHGYVKGFEKTCSVKDGKRLVISMTLTLMPDKKRILISTKDITNMKEHERQLEYIAHYDSLTGLPNRVLKSDRLRQAMAQAQRREERLAVIYLDLDGFKEVNDRYGHSIGDRLLIALSARMKQALREGDTLSRLGGDEFVAILVDMPDTSNALPIVHRLLDAANQPIRIDDLMIQVSASVGVTFYPQDEDVDGDQLIRQADQAMYEAKQAGKNRFHIFDSEHDRTIRTRHENVERIHQALKNNEFVLYYQPKINMRTGTIIGAEALIRWQHPERGLVAPMEFLPIIENHPLAVEIGEWVIDSALAQVQQWNAQGLRLRVSVNVGARQLLQEDFVERLRLILERHAGFASLLEIEVLETSALEDVNHAAEVIEACRTMGIRFALDDFGTGYSSLTYLKRLPIAILKIDQSFVRDMLDDPDDMAILEGIIGLASAFRREVIAEGVETVEHGTSLLSLGCDLAQGYGIARPMPSSQLLEWSQNWRFQSA